MNHNAYIVSKYAKRTVFANKGRSILTLVGIIVATIMFSIVASAQVSVLDLLNSFKGDEYGIWHVQGYSMSTLDYAKICKDPRLKSGAFIQEIGYDPGIDDGLIVETIVDDLWFIDRYTYFFGAMSPNFPEMGNLNVVKGELPKDDTEVIIPLELYDSSGWEIGTKINAKMYSRYSEGRKVNNLSEITTLNSVTDEQLYMIGQKEYTIVGFYVMPRYTRWNNICDYAILTVTDHMMMGNAVNAYFELNVPSEYVEFAKDHFETDNDCLYNKEFIRMENSADDSTLQMRMGLIFGAAIAIITLLAVMLIYNSFSTSSSERIRAIGLLKSVGATRRQVRQLMFVEAFLYSIIGIPIGIVCGQGVSWLLFHLVRNLLKAAARYFVERQIVFAYRFSLSGIAGTVLITLITILVAIILPMSKVSKIAPIEAIRANEVFSNKGIRKHASGFWTKVIGFTNALSLKNFFRYRKRYRATVISIVASVLMIIFAHLMVNYVSSEYSFGPMNGEERANEVTYTKFIYDRTFTPTDRAMFYKLADQKEVKSSTMILNIMSSTYIRRENAAEEIWNLLSDQDSEYNTDSEAEIPAEIVFVEDSAWRELCEENGLDPEPFLEYGSELCIIENSTTWYAEGGKEIHLEVFDSLPEKMDIIISGDSEAGAGLITVRPVSVNRLEGIEELPEGMFRVFIPMGRFGYYKLDRFYGQATFIFNCSDPAAFYAKARPILEKNLYRTDLLKDKGISIRARKATVTLSIIVFYGYVAMLSLLCFLNVIMTVIGNIVFRRKEYILLTSVGMSRKTLFRMVIGESQVYCAESLLLLLIIGVILEVVIGVCIHPMSHSIREIIYFVSVIFIHWFVVITTTAVGLSSVMRDDIIEGLRKEYY